MFSITEYDHLGVAQQQRFEAEITAVVKAELNGRANTRSGTAPVGTESRSVVRVGSRFTSGPVRFDGALLLGVTERDPSWGFTAGLTWVFKAFTIPNQ